MSQLGGGAEQCVEQRISDLKAQMKDSSKQQQAGVGSLHKGGGKRALHLDD